MKLQVEVKCKSFVTNLEKKNLNCSVNVIPYVKKYEAEYGKDDYFLVGCK